MGAIGIGWIGEAGPDPVLLGHVGRQLASAFHPPVRLFTPSARPRQALDPGRNQYASGEILRCLLPLAPPGGKVLGITDQDLFVPFLTYVLGEAQLIGEVDEKGQGLCRECRARLPGHR